MARRPVAGCRPQARRALEDGTRLRIEALRPKFDGDAGQTERYGATFGVDDDPAHFRPGMLQAVGSQVSYDMRRRAVRAAVEILRGEDTGHYHRIMESVLFTRERPDDVQSFLDRRRRLGLDD